MMILITICVVSIVCDFVRLLNISLYFLNSDKELDSGMMDWLLFKLEEA